MGTSAAGRAFRRGDANLDGVRNIADVVSILLALFAGGLALQCDSAIDVNDDGVPNVADCIYLLEHLHLGGPPPPAPVDCGADPTPGTSCDAVDTGC